MGHLAPLSRSQRRILAQLSSFLRERGLYLAGGVAVAVHRHHRRSMDLDFFSRRAPLDLLATRDALVRERLPLEVVSLTDALTYFDDAESSSVRPAGLTHRHWREIRSWFEQHAAAALQRLATKSGSGIKRGARATVPSRKRRART
jgi:hypothetical protein